MNWVPRHSYAGSFWRSILPTSRCDLLRDTCVASCRDHYTDCPSYRRSHSRLKPRVYGIQTYKDARCGTALQIRHHTWTRATYTQLQLSDYAIKIAMIRSVTTRHIRMWGKFMLVSLQEQVDESKDSDKDEEATYDAQACTAEEILYHMPTTIVASRMHCPVLVKNNTDEIYCECKDE